MNELGLLPELSRVRLNEGVRQILIRFRDDDFVFVRRLRLDRRQSSDLAAVLRGCWGQHLGELPRGRAAALEGSAGVESASSPIED